MKYSVSVNTQKARNEVLETSQGLVVSLRAAPDRGKANAALVCVLADHFKVPKSSIEIRSGLTSRRKIVEKIKNPA
jgi:uncharacterized protein